MYSTRIAPEAFKTSTKETIARIQATSAATERRSHLYMATVLIGGIIAVGVMLTLAAL